MGREERERKEEDRPSPLVHVSNAHAASHSPQFHSWLRRSTSLPQELWAPNELILILPQGLHGEEAGTGSWNWELELQMKPNHSHRVHCHGFFKCISLTFVKG